MNINVTALHVKDTATANGVGGDYAGDDEYDDGYDDTDGGMPLDGCFADEEHEDSTKKIKLSDEQKMICTPLVRGYALKEKMWLNFFV